MAITQGKHTYETYFILYNNIVWAQNFIKDNNLTHFDYDAYSNLRAVRSAYKDELLFENMKKHKRIIAPDFHNNEDAADIIEVCIRTLVEHRQDVSKLSAYYIKHFGEEEHSKMMARIRVSVSA